MINLSKDEATINRIDEAKAIDSLINQYESEAYGLEGYSEKNELSCYIGKSIIYLYHIKSLLFRKDRYYDSLESDFNSAIKAIMPALEYLNLEAGDPDYEGQFFALNIMPLLNLKHKILKSCLDYESYKKFLNYPKA